MHKVYLIATCINIARHLRVRNISLGLIEKTNHPMVEAALTSRLDF